MRILITGGAGLVGSSLCLKLKEKYPNYQFIVFDNLVRRGSELNLPDIKKAGATFIQGDIRNIEDLEKAGSFDLMIETSAEPSVLAGITSDPSYIISNNLYGSVNCFNACIKNKAQLVFLSTSRVYPVQRIENANYVEQLTRFTFSDNQTEKGISALGISEELNMSGYRSFYGATKLASEILLEEYAQFYNLQAAVTRFSVIAGPRQMGKSDQGIASLWMAKHYFKQPLKYIGFGGSGKQLRDVLHIDDVVALIDYQIHNMQQFTGKVYNAGGGINCSASLLEMSSICEKITGNKITIEKELLNRPADLKAYITDNTQISKETGWRPQKSIDDVFADIYKWINKNEVSLKDIFN